MRARIIALPLICLVLVAPGSGGQIAAATNTPATNGTHAPVLSPLPASSWLINRIDPPTTGLAIDRGAYNSVAWAGNTPWVSYYDTTNHDLRLAHPVSSGGNCGPSNSWKCEVIDNGGGMMSASTVRSRSIRPRQI